MDQCGLSASPSRLRVDDAIEKALAWRCRPRPLSPLQPAAAKEAEKNDSISAHALSRDLEAARYAAAGLSGNTMPLTREPAGGE